MNSLFTRSQQSFANFLESHELRFDNIVFSDILDFFSVIWRRLKEFLESTFKRLGAFKVHSVLNCSMRKEKSDQRLENAYFSSNMELLVHTDFINSTIVNLTNEMFRRAESFVLNGSDWIVERVKVFYLNIARFHFIRGRAYIKLPPIIYKKHACINVKDA